jgi:pimeloyl-ACP methyl ester carboxylesterase
MNGDTPILLMSGMGADARVFSKQIEALPQITVPEWIDPLPKESLASYSKRLAKAIDPGRPCYIGGASFGGFIALEMIQHLDVKACFLIGSVRSPKEFPSAFKMLKKMACMADAIPFEVATLLSKVALLSSGCASKSHLTALVKQMSESDASFLRWACRAVIEWQGAENMGDTPVFQVHGGKDLVLPVKNTTPDTVVPGAGHALSMSHPDEVTDFVRRMIDSVEQQCHRVC